MPPRVFLQKSAEVIENKRRACEKERKERKRGCKLLGTKGLGGTKAETPERKEWRTISCEARAA
jgi:adenylosuccinate synthase